MKKISRLFLLLTLLTSATYAQDVQASPQLGSNLELVYPMSTGQSAPFPGVLFSSKATARVVAEYSLFDERLQLEVDTAVAVSQAKMKFEMKELESKCTSDKEVLTAQVDSRNDKISILERDLGKSEAEVRRLNEEMPSRSVWFGLGFAGGVVFTIAAAYAIGQVAN